MDRTKKYIQGLAPLIYFVVYAITIGVPRTALTIASFVVLAQNWHATCDGFMLSLPVWLLVYAIIETIYLVSSAWASYNSQTELGINVLTYSTGGDQCFLLIWNILGAVSLYRDSRACEIILSPLWIMTATILIIQWVIMSCFCCLFCVACCCASKKKSLSDVELGKIDDKK